jgi:DNA-binding MarR family transcriptional regulator
VTETRQQAAAELGRALQRYQRSVQAFDDSVGRHLGLNPADLRCLDWLTDGPLTAGQLSQATGLRPAATTALIDRLVAKGYLRRVPAARDRRRVLVELTENGASRTWACYGPMVQEGESLLSGFNRAELAKVRDLLDAMVELTERHEQRLRSAN